MQTKQVPVQDQSSFSSAEPLKKESKGTVGQRKFNDKRPEFFHQQAIQKMANDKQVMHPPAIAPVQKKSSGLPEPLRNGIENLSGMSMDSVNVHYNSSKPAQLQAHAYAQGNNIHIGPGQEKHLPHEAWHVVQQKQGRVKPTIQMKTGTPVNDDPALEKEADVMGAKAMAPAVQRKENTGTGKVVPFHNRVTQRFVGEPDDNSITEGSIRYITDGHDRVTQVVGAIRVNAPESGRGEAQGRTTQGMRDLYHILFNKNGVQFNGGHILAHHHAGNPGMQNMVPLERYYNQHGGYKAFENSVDHALQTTPRGRLYVSVTVTYPADSLDGVLTNLVQNPGSAKLLQIRGNAAAVETIKNVFRRLPISIQMTLCSDGTTNYIGTITQPTNPRAPLAANIRHNANLVNITGADANSREHIYGPGSVPGHVVHEAQGSAYHANMKHQYRNMQKPGIIRYYGGANGLAGGVMAYTWMDPLGTQDKFGGTNTIDSADPLGSDFRILNLGRIVADDALSPWIKGHYLNQGLHGPGHDSRNLVPLTRSANAVMSRDFEQPVKQSAALVDPNRGVYVMARSQGQVARPGNWQRNDALAAHSERLWDAEAILPDRLELNAYEGEQKSDGIPFITTRRVVGPITVYNRLHEGDPNLGRTILPGGQHVGPTSVAYMQNRTKLFNPKTRATLHALTRQELSAFGRMVDQIQNRGDKYAFVLSILNRYANTNARKQLLLDYLHDWHGNRLDYAGALHRIQNQFFKQLITAIIEALLHGVSSDHLKKTFDHDKDDPEAPAPTGKTTDHARPDIISPDWNTHARPIEVAS